jgi:tRNA (cmo5U34)-methyltransferase
VAETADNGFQGDRAAQFDARARINIPGYVAMHDMVCAILSQGLAKDARLLVVGAGTGMELVLLGMNNPGWRFTGVDPSADMLGVARETLEMRGLAERVELFEGVIHDLPGDDRFDAATSVLVMHFLPDDGGKAAYLKAIAERLRPGAPLVLVDQHGPRPSPAFDEKIAQWKRYQLLQGLPAEDAEASMVRRLGANHYVPEERIVALLQEAGFEQVERFYQAFVVGGWSARRA